MHAAVEVDLRAEQRRERVHRGSTTHQPAEKHPDDAAGDRYRLGSVVGEVATGVPVGLG